MKQIILIASAIFFFTFNVKAQKPVVFSLGVTEKIVSAVFHETRTLNIYLPEGYSPDSATLYPVIYLLDGSANEDFIHIVGVVQFLTMIEAMPKSIVVGIANVDRKRDLTFPTTIEKDKKAYPTTGSSAAFMAFIEKELQPFINSKFKVSKERTIIGQSLGGLFATEVLLKKPALFSNYLIVSPSLWWDNESLLAASAQLLSNAADLHIRTIISVGKEGPQMENDAKNLSEILKHRIENMKTDFVFLPDENHLTILHNSIYKALMMLYAKK